MDEPSPNLAKRLDSKEKNDEMRRLRAQEVLDLEDQRREKREKNVCKRVEKRMRYLELMNWLVKGDDDRDVEEPFSEYREHDVQQVYDWRRFEDDKNEDDDV
nr:hypothetical protein [Tanacetum cinerariifolium]